jgi:hypothetical protein
MPPTKEGASEWLQKIKVFKERALDLFHRATVERPFLDFSLTQEQEQQLLKVKNNRYSHPEGAKIVRGGESFVFFLDSIPGFVFNTDFHYESSGNLSPYETVPA